MFIVGEMGEETESVATTRAAGLAARAAGGAAREAGRAGHNGVRGGRADERSSRMADQVSSGTVQGAAREPSGHDSHGSDVQPLEGLVTPAQHTPFHGRPVSWVSVSTIIVGFILGAIGLV